MKKNILFIFLLFSFSTLSAQISFYIQEIEVNNICIHESEDLIIEGEKEGPDIWIEFTIKNNYKIPVKLLPSNSNMWLNFNYKNRIYKRNIFSFTFLEKDLLELSPNEEYHNFASTRLFLGTTLIKEKGDYVFELMEVLPTLKLYYKEEDLTMISSEIKNVKVVYKCKE